MPPTRPPYPSELKHQIIELVRDGKGMQVSIVVGVAIIDVVE